MIGRDFSHNLFDQRQVGVPLDTLRQLIEDAALLSISDDITIEQQHTWASGPAPDFWTARGLAPDAPTYLASALRQLLADDRETASLVYGIIAHQARSRYEIPPVFTAGWLASNVTWAGGAPVELPAGLDTDAFIEQATSEENLKTL